MRPRDVVCAYVPRCVRTRREGKHPRAGWRPGIHVQHFVRRHRTLGVSDVHMHEQPRSEVRGRVSSLGWLFDHERPSPGRL
jgi:hypothetical protein